MRRETSDHGDRERERKREGLFTLLFNSIVKKVLLPKCVKVCEDSLNANANALEVDRRAASRGRRGWCGSTVELT